MFRGSEIQPHYSRPHIVSGHYYSDLIEAIETFVPGWHVNKLLGFQGCS